MPKTARALVIAAVAIVVGTAAAPLAQAADAAGTRIAAGIGWDGATLPTGTASAQATGIGWDSVTVPTAPALAKATGIGWD